MGDDLIEVGQLWRNVSLGGVAEVVAVDAVEAWRACLRLDDGKLHMTRGPLPETRKLIGYAEVES